SRSWAAAPGIPGRVMSATTAASATVSPRRRLTPHLRTQTPGTQVTADAIRSHYSSLAVRSGATARKEDLTGEARVAAAGHGTWARRHALRWTVGGEQDQHEGEGARRHHDLRGSEHT